MSFPTPPSPLPPHTPHHLTPPTPHRPPLPPTPPPSPQPGPRPSRAVAFEEFSRGPGAELSLALQHNKAALRDCKTAAKAAGMRVNEAKRAIDACKARVEELRGARGDKGEGDGEGEGED